MNANIIALDYYLPEGTLTNEQLAGEVEGFSADRIFAKTGIRSRHIAGPDECASDLGVAAARKLFEQDGCDPESVDFLLFCTQTPDYILPGSAAMIHQQLGLRADCGALDFNLGCSGFVYGLALAKSLIETQLAGRVLLITGDTYTKLIHPQDKSVRTVFGDGASATLLGASDHPALGPFLFGTDGQGSDKLMVPAGALRCPPSPETMVEETDSKGNTRSLMNLKMNGPEIFAFTLKTVPKTIDDMLARSGKTMDDIDYFIFHQANQFMLTHLRDKIGIPPEKFWLDMETCGNTVSTTIPIALHDAFAQGAIKNGDCVMLVGFGVGYSWSATLLVVNL